MGFKKYFFLIKETGNPVGFPIIQKGKNTLGSCISLILNPCKAQECFLKAKITEHKEAVDGRWDKKATLSLLTYSFLDS